MCFGNILFRFLYNINKMREFMFYDELKRLHDFMSLLIKNSSSTVHFHGRFRRSPAEDAVFFQLKLTATGRAEPLKSTKAPQRTYTAEEL